jgi:hypothetical protein
VKISFPTIRPKDKIIAGHVPPSTVTLKSGESISTGDVVLCRFLGFSASWVLRVCQLITLTETTISGTFWLAYCCGANSPEGPIALELRSIIRCLSDAEIVAFRLGARPESFESSAGG